MTYEKFPQDVKSWRKILIDDGKLVLEVLKPTKKIPPKNTYNTRWTTKLEKRVNLPNTDVSLPALYRKRY